MTDTLSPAYDVIVIGGGPAGLNGALMLARSRRSVAVIDAGQPRNAPAHAIHGLLGRDGTPPGELLAQGREEVRGYGGHVVSGEVADARAVDDGFTVTLTDGRTATARRLLVTTGLTDVLPDVPGLRECWGRDVLHCPYCHGWEVRDQAIGVLASSVMSVHQALLFTQLTDDVTFFRNGQEVGDDDLALLRARGVAVVGGGVAALEVEDDRLTGVRLDDGTFITREAVVVGPRFVANAAFLESLGLKMVEHPMGVGDYLPVDPMTYRTDVPGVWAAGNVTDFSAQVGMSAAAGAMAGAQINADLVMTG
jgi:thioredoxin reductase